MPLLYLDLIEGRSPSEVRALLDAIHDTVVEAFGVPERDRYQVVRTHPAHEIVTLDTGLGIDRSSRQVVVHVVSRRRPRELKQKFYELLASRLADRCGLDPADLIVSVTENGDEDWSFGHGRAQFLTGELKVSVGTGLRTRLTELFGIERPIVLAPMALASGGRLAAAVTRAGGLGLIGGGYPDAEWLRSQIDRAEGARVGYGFISWSLARNPGVLAVALEQRPAAVMLSFGELQPFADRIHAAGVPLLAQVQNLDQARQALDAGAEVVVAQGGEAGGHGMSVRSTFTLVPEVVDFVADRSPDTLVVAAGGVSDGRGLAAALALGADGAVVGTRFWATPEALVSPRAQQRAVAAGGDDTVRTRVYDVVRRLDWPAGYNARALSNAFLDTWHGNEAGLSAQLPEAIGAYEKAVAAEDFDTAAILTGEGVGRIREVRPAAEIVADMVGEAKRILNRDGAP